MRKLFLFSFAALLALAAVGVAAEPETDAGKAVEKASQGAAAVDADPAQMKASPFGTPTASSPTRLFTKSSRKGRRTALAELPSCP